MGSAEQIIRASQNDVPAIRELTRAAYAKWVPVICREPKPMTADYDFAVRNHIIDLLYVGNAVAALIEMIPKDDFLLIENVAVAPAFQGQGYGCRLISHAEKLARTLGFKETRLYTNKLFGENVRLYLRLGYDIEREEEFKGGLVVHMSKAISQNS